MLKTKKICKYCMNTAIFVVNAFRIINFKINFVVNLQKNLQALELLIIFVVFFLMRYSESSYNRKLLVSY